MYIINHDILGKSELGVEYQDLKPLLPPGSLRPAPSPRDLAYVFKFCDICWLWNYVQKLLEDVKWRLFVSVSAEALEEDINKAGGTPSCNGGMRANVNLGFQSLAGKAGKISLERESFGVLSITPGSWERGENTFPTTHLRLRH